MEWERVRRGQEAGLVERCEVVGLRGAGHQAKCCGGAWSKN